MAAAGQRTLGNPNILLIITLYSERPLVWFAHLRSIGRIAICLQLLLLAKLLPVASRQRVPFINCLGLVS